MPSQKGKVTTDELEAIADYMFKHFNQKNLLQAQAIQNRLKKMPIGKRLALQNNCLSCHKIDRKIVGPSFRDIAKRYKNNLEQIKNSIKNGSKKRWKSSNGAMMPKFAKKIKDKDIELIAKWIMKWKN